MNNIGRTYPSEMKRYNDPKTGREIIQLTDKYENGQLYFTDNSFTLGDREIYFISNRPNADSHIFNFFKMDLETGLITQVTDEPTGISGGKTKTPDSSILVYITDDKTVLKKLDTRSGEVTVLYKETGNYKIDQPFISCDKQYVGFTRNEKHPPIYGKNYVGFKETMYNIKKANVTIAKMDGSGAKNVFCDTHWLGHFQFSPHKSNLATFCHEGPWNMVQQRIWILDVSTGEIEPCFRQEEDDSVGHEFWTRDGLICFDNRRAGHDGTITVNRTQAVAKESLAKEGQVPYIAFANEKGEVIKTIDMPFYLNHYHANSTNTMLVGDEVDDLVLVDLADDKAEPTVLLNHATSWNGHNTHCHPTWGWNDKKILYTSDRDGRSNLYIVEINQ